MHGESSLMHSLLMPAERTCRIISKNTMHNYFSSMKGRKRKDKYKQRREKGEENGKG